MNFKRWLEELIPWTGRCIREDGSTVNVGDATAGALDFSGSVSMIEHEHRKTHQGETFISEYMVYLSGTTAQNFIFVTGDDSVHMKEVEVVPDADEVAVAMFEDTVSTGGTQQTFAVDGLANLSMQGIQLNRNSNKTSGCQILATPTITQQGTQHIFLKFLPGSEGQGQRTSGTSATSDWERVLKSNHRYHLWVKRLAGTGVTRVKIKLRYYVVRV